MAEKVAARLERTPWINPKGEKITAASVNRPAALAAELVGKPFASVRDAVRGAFADAPGLVFVGACGIAVRAVAPCLRHKSVDPPVAVIDPGASFVISLLSGHWGGGDSLARHLAAALGAQAIISGASDCAGAPAIDKIAAARGLRIVDWRLLPRAQNAVLEGAPTPLIDPLGLLADSDIFCPVRAPVPGRVSVRAGLVPPRGPDVLRVVKPIICFGVGFRKDCPSLADDFYQALAALHLPPETARALATVDAKRGDPFLSRLARDLGAELIFAPAGTLAGIETPTPSAACGARFNLPPFSVAESAAIFAAGGSERAVPLAPKLVIKGRLTLAAAIPRSILVGACADEFYALFPALLQSCEEPGRAS